MKKLFLILLASFFVTNFAEAACSSQITRTSYTANQILTSSSLNTQFDTVYSHVNDLDGSCITDGTVTQAKLDTSTLDVLLNAIHMGFKCSRSDSNTIGISKGRIAVNGNLISETGSNTVTWGCSGCSSETTSDTYYVYAQSNTSLDPLISTTAPGDDGYNGTSKVLCRFYNEENSDIASGTVDNWAVNDFEWNGGCAAMLSGGANGTGSTAVSTREYEQIDFNRSCGNWTITRSAVNGDKIVIDSDGYYEISAQDGVATGVSGFGITKNSSNTATSIYNLPHREVLSVSDSDDTSGVGQVFWGGFLVSGDTIRAQAQSSTVTSSDFVKFTIRRIR